MQDISNNHIRAALYCRVSSDEQKQGKNIDSQIKELEDFANANNYKIVERYVEDGWSGAILERPELDRLRDNATKDLFEAVLINDVDRLSRKMLHLGIIKRDLEKKGIKLIFKKLPNHGDPLSNFMINVLGSFAEFERQMIADRVRRGKRYKAEVRNLILGNIPPFGYSYVRKVKGKEGHYKIDKKEVKIVKMMFNWVVQEGLSQRQVTKRLVERKIPARKVSSWPKSSVHRLLTNSTYIGVTYWNKHKCIESTNSNNQIKYRKKQKSSTVLRPKEEWIPIKLPNNLRIIDKKVFYAAQRQFQKNKCYSERNNNKNFYLLKGLTQCGLCKSPYTGDPCHGRLFYRCGNRHRTFPNPKECKASIISAPKLEGLVWKNVVNAIQNPKIVIDQVKKFEEKKQKEPAETEQEIKNIKTELTGLETEEERLLNAYRKGIITLTPFKKEMDKLNNERSRLNSDLEELKYRKDSQISKKGVIIKSIKEYGRIFKNKINEFTPIQRQVFLRFLLEKVIIEKNRIRILGLIPVYAEPQEKIDVLKRFSEFLDSTEVATFAGNMKLVPSYGGIKFPTL